MNRKGGIGLLRMLWPMCVLGIISGCTFGACTDFRNDYSEYRQIAKEGWRYADTLTFTPVHSDTVCAGQLVVALRHDISYPYNELWLEVLSVHDDMGGNRAGLRCDTLHFVLADRFGSWQGDGIGGLFQLADTLSPIIHRSGSPVKIRHIMRVDTLCGISHLGIFFLTGKKWKTF